MLGRLPVPPAVPQPHDLHRFIAHAIHDQVRRARYAPHPRIADTRRRADVRMLTQPLGGLVNALGDGLRRERVFVGDAGLRFVEVDQRLDRHLSRSIHAPLAEHAAHFFLAREHAAVSRRQSFLDRLVEACLFDQVAPRRRIRQRIDQLVRFLLEHGGHVRRRRFCGSHHFTPPALAAVREALAVLRRRGHLVPGANLKAATTWYRNAMHRLDVQGHALRYAFARERIDAYEPRACRCARRWRARAWTSVTATGADDG